MDIRITVDGEAADAHRELLDRLRREPELRGVVREVRRPSRPDAMGVPVELLVSVLGSGVLTAVARSVRTYLEHRRSDVKVEVNTERGHPSLNVTDARDPEGLLRKLGEIIADLPSPEQESRPGSD